MVWVRSSTHISAIGSPDMDKRSLILIILGALAAGIVITALYLVFTWHGRLLTILGAVIMMLYAPSDGTMATTLVQAISNALGHLP